MPYLTDEAIFSTLGFIAGLPGGAHVVFDYVNPAASVIEPGRRAAHEALAARVAAMGESIRNHFDSDALHVRLKALGFRDVEDLGWAEIAARFFPGRADIVRRRRACAARVDGVTSWPEAAGVMRGDRAIAWRFAASLRDAGIAVAAPAG